MAHHLRGLGVGPEVVVGLCVERSLQMLVGLLGILKAGGAYLPLDPGYPPDRLAFMLEDSRAPVVVTQSALADDLPAHGRDLELDTIGRRSRGTRKCAAQHRHAAKQRLCHLHLRLDRHAQRRGRDHRNIARLVRETNYFMLTATTCACSWRRWFDASTFEIWGARLNGAKLGLCGRRVDLPRLKRRSAAAASACCG